MRGVTHYAWFLVKKLVGRSLNLIASLNDDGGRELEAGTLYNRGFGGKIGLWNIGRIMDKNSKEVAINDLVAYSG